MTERQPVRSRHVIQAVRQQASAKTSAKASIKSMEQGVTLQNASNPLIQGVTNKNPIGLKGQSRYTLSLYSQLSVTRLCLHEFS